MNIDQIQKVVQHSDESQTVTIYQPNREPYRASDGKECTITVVGSESKKYRAARDALTRKVLRRNRRQRAEPEELLSDRIDIAAACITAWSGWESDGKPVPLTLENAKSLLSVEHILLQAEDAINEWADGFLQKSKSSPK